ncbi:MAG: TerC family protein [Kofleriaceae bacterium]|jgi:tellurite resistance protein TerC|nr:TerC family protein [Kofleriaceae bacterium]MBP6836962.1 TerC family protein [Kofleriaceae bacterium]MBP9204833.1 TerC family protein [Kofleriaceae bacterium]
MDSIGAPVYWIGFLAFVAVMLALDLGVFHRKSHRVSMREAATWSVVWVSMAGLFALLVWRWFGSERALEFTAGYLIEKSLSVDNLFVFVLVFSALAIPPALQHRVLFWGILGALAFRAGFILAGGALLAKFHWLIYVFGALLLLSGVKMLMSKEHGPADLSKSRALRWFRKLVPTTDTLEGDRFWVRRAGRLMATPLLAALVLIEASDIVFAVDSVPAIFAVSQDPFIVFTSNIFAIMGLRSMYFLLAGVLDKFAYLKHGLAAILVFIGGKMMLLDVYKIPIPVSLGTVAAILLVSIGVSLWLAPRPVHGADADPPTPTPAPAPAPAP